MVINKIGQQHIDFGTNCQDYGVEFGQYKLVCDGCSEGKHSEVGAKMFCHLAQNNFTLSNPFYIAARLFIGGATQSLFQTYLLDIFGQSSQSIRDFLCFTIMFVQETDTSFLIAYCGDGYIIKQKNNGEIILEEINDGEYPKYFVYNFTDRNHLKQYKDGVDFTTEMFSKKDYSRIGIASDGLRFIDKDPEHRGEFIELLKQGKEAPLKRFINKHQSIFKDDITIVF